MSFVDFMLYFVLALFLLPLVQGIAALVVMGIVLIFTYISEALS